jgi:hypothetical protein
MSYRNGDQHVVHRTEMNEDGTLVVVVADTPPPSPLSSSSSSSIPTPTLLLQEQAPPSPSPSLPPQHNQGNTTFLKPLPPPPPPPPLHVVVLLVDQDCHHFEVVRVEVQPNEIIVSEVLAQASSRAIHSSLQTQSYQGMCCNDGGGQRLIGPTSPLTELKQSNNNNNNKSNTNTTNIFMVEEKGSVRARPILALAVPMNIKVDDFVQKARAILGHPIVLDEVRTVRWLVGWLVGLCELVAVGLYGSSVANNTTIHLGQTTHTKILLWQTVFVFGLGFRFNVKALILRIGT